MKQCSVPSCGYVGEPGDFPTVFVPQSPYRPGDMVVRCPSCKRAGKLSDLKESITEFERQKREAMRTWVPLRPLAREVSRMLSHADCVIPVKDGQHYER